MGFEHLKGDLLRSRWGREQRGRKSFHADFTGRSWLGGKVGGSEKSAMGKPKRPEGVGGIQLSPEAELGRVDLGIPPPASISLDENEVRVRAYERFLEREGRDGDADGDWLEAEREIRERRWNRMD